MSKKLCAVIPCRIHSTRFPEKVFAEFQGKSLLQTSIDIAKSTEIFDQIVVASSDNDDRVKSICKLSGVEFLHVTKASCGSEKVVDVAEAYTGYDEYISIPVDEPAIDPIQLKYVLVQEFKHITTLFCNFFTSEDLRDSRSCKIVSGHDGKVLYTSRAVIPATKNALFLELDAYKKHVGVFIFPASLIDRRLWTPTRLSQVEGLEQNMLLGSLYCSYIPHIGFGVDSPEQLHLLELRVQ